MQEGYLAPRSYFTALITQMKVRGYSLLAWCRMGHEEVPYHVPCITARSNSLFFWIPGKALIAQAVFTEHLEVQESWWNEEQIRAYQVTSGLCDHWSISFYLQLGEDEVMNWYKEKLRTTECSWEINTKIPISCPGTSWLTNCHVELFGDTRWDDVYYFLAGDLGARHFCYNRRERIRACQVANALTSVTEPLKQFAASRFGSLQVTSFPPHYCFQGCEPLWWSRFPLKRLTRRTNRIFGSDFNLK